MPAPHSSINAWLKLLRPPNLLTVPGDPVAGFLLAGGGDVLSAVWAALASLLFYMAGLVSNDCFDRHEDARDRPDRPLPSGSVSLTAAAGVSGLLFAAGLGVAALAGAQVLGVAVVLAGLVLTYNGLAKKRLLPGALCMGACRGASLLLGAAAASPQPLVAGWNGVTVAAVGLSLYIAAVTALADRETEKRPLPWRRWLPALSVTCCMGSLWVVSGGGAACWLFSLLALAAVAWPLRLGYRLGGSPAPAVLIPSIGRFIRGLLLIQAAFMASSGLDGGIAAAITLAAWPLSVVGARRFYAS